MKYFSLAFSFVLLGVLLFVRADARGFDWVWIHRFTMLFAGLLVYAGAWVFSVPRVRPLGFGLYFVFQALAFAALCLHPNYSGPVQTALRLSAALSLAGLCFSLLVLVCWRTLSAFRLAFIVLGLFLSLSVLFYGGAGDVPFLHNPSTAGVLLAVLAAGFGAPTLYQVLVCSSAVLWVHTVTALMVLVVGLTARYCKRLWLAGPILLAGAAGLYRAFPAKFQDGNGRFEVWHQVLAYFTAHSWQTQLFGEGAGSTPVLVPLIQLSHGTNPAGLQFFMYLHSDWLQILFEFGLAGFACAVYLYIVALHRSRGRWYLTSSLLAYGAAMVSGFPLHSPILALLGLVLMGVSLTEA